MVEGGPKTLGSPRDSSYSITVVVVRHCLLPEKILHAKLLGLLLIGCSLPRCELSCNRYALWDGVCICPWAQGCVYLPGDLAEWAFPVFI